MKSGITLDRARRLASVPLLLAVGTTALGQTVGAQLTRQQKPVYPESLFKGLRQGNVLLIGRIDTNGKVQDILPVAASHELFVEPAVTAVRDWQFKPAMRDGKPVEIAANIAVQFRLQGEHHGEVPRTILGDLGVFPGDASGNRAAPDGFPIWRGHDPRVRIEAVLDVAPAPNPRTLAVEAEAVSPKGKHIRVYASKVPVAAKAEQVGVPFSFPIGGDWEDGIWMIRFDVDKAEAGAGQFWLAGDPAHYSFIKGQGLAPISPKAAPTARLPRKR